MTPNIDPNIFITLICGVFAVTFIVLLPVLSEFKKPKGAESKSIDDITLSSLSGKIETSLIDIEKSCEKEEAISMKLVNDLIAFLPNLEV